MKNRIRFTFDSKLTMIREELPYVLDCLRLRMPYLSDADLFELRLVYSELLANAILHGNKEDTSKKVELIIDSEPDAIHTVIRDEGMGFDHAETLNRVFRNDNTLTESGHGLMLVNRLTDSVRFNDKGNEIEVHKKITNPIHDHISPFAQMVPVTP